MRTELELELEGFLLDDNEAKEREAEERGCLFWTIWFDLRVKSEFECLNLKGSSKREGWGCCGSGKEREENKEQSNANEIRSGAALRLRS